MAKYENKRIRPDLIDSDTSAFYSLQTIANYRPANQAYTLEEVTKLFDVMNQKKALEVQRETEYKAARDAAANAEWQFHNAILGVKSQVKALFGDDSNEVQALGLKKKSEYKRPSPKTRKEDSAT